MLQIVLFQCWLNLRYPKFKVPVHWPKPETTKLTGVLYDATTTSVQVDVKNLTN